MEEVNSIELYIKDWNENSIVLTVSKNGRTEPLAVRTAFGGKCLNMPISCVAFGCTNKQISSRNKGKVSSEGGNHASCEEGSPERAHIAFHR